MKTGRIKRNAFIIFLAYISGLNATQDQILNIPLAKSIIYIFILLLGFLFYKWIKYRRNKNFNRFRADHNMPANLWFYSKLIDMELSIEKADFMHLEKLFYDYLTRKYKLNKQNMSSEEIINQVKVLESEMEVLDLYAYVYEQIKTESNQDNQIKDVIKNIKIYFNKDDFSVWLQSRNTGECNNC
jgi:hypothetical protein